MDWHTARVIRTHRRSSWLFIAHQPAQRLVVFVHGFMGKSIESWRNFDTSGEISDWWRSSDMLFFGYDSLTDNILGTANRLRQLLADFYPHPPADFFTVQGTTIREYTGLPYQELVLVGHSLGGVVIRRAVLDFAHNWLVARDVLREPLPELLSARVFLFSPANGGFGPSGKLAIARELGLLRYAEVFLRAAPAYSELQLGSAILRTTREMTKVILDKFEFLNLTALKPAVLFANPDNVVNVDRYWHDQECDSCDGTSHSSVCKPDHSYWAPWYMVENQVVRLAVQPGQAYQA